MPKLVEGIGYIISATTQAVLDPVKQLTILRDKIFQGSTDVNHTGNQKRCFIT